MLRLRSPGHDSSEIGYVRAALGRGELVLLPTDTVYGLAAAASDPVSCHRLYDLKGRDRAQPTAVLFASIEAVGAALPELSERASEAVQALLPGPYTLIVRNPAESFRWVCGDWPQRIGLRVPQGAYPLPPLAATSANLAGQPEIEQVDDLPRELMEHLACGVDVGPLGGIASTVLDLSAWEDRSGDIVVLRDPGERARRALTQLGAWL